MTARVTTTPRERRPRTERRLSATEQPARAKACAVASPSPLPAPVTSTARPSSRWYAISSFSSSI